MVNALRAFIADNVKLSSHFLHTHAPSTLMAPLQIN